MHYTIGVAQIMLYRDNNLNVIDRDSAVANINASEQCIPEKNHTKDIDLNI